MRTWRTIFSSTTIAWSTKMPIARANPPKVIELMVLPVKYNPTTEAKHGQRNHDHDNQRRSDTTQENEYDQAGEHRTKSLPQIASLECSP